MDTQATISIASINLEESHLKVLEFLISYYFKDRFALAKKKDSKVQILYINSVNANKKINKYQKKYPNSLFVIITNQTVENSLIPVVNLPVTPRKLSDALYQISHELESSLKLTISKDIVSETPNDTSTKTISKKTPKKERAKQHTKPQKDTKEKQPEGVNDKNRVYTKEIKNLKNEINENIYNRNENSKKTNKVVDNKIKPTLDEYDFYLDLDSYVEDRAREHLENKTLTKNNKKKDSQNKKPNKIMHAQKHITIAKDKLNFMSSRPDIDLDNASLISKISYNPNSYLQGYLNIIYKSPRLNCVDVSHGVITYNQENHTACINVNNRTLQNISSIGKLKTQYSLIDLLQLYKSIA